MIDSTYKDIWMATAKVRIMQFCDNTSDSFARNRSTQKLHSNILLFLFEILSMVRLEKVYLYVNLLWKGHNARLVKTYDFTLYCV